MAGARSNDVLLQYYGFVAANNPHDTYALSPADLIVETDAACPGGLRKGAVASLNTAAPGVADASNTIYLTRDGADDAALRLVRLLLHPDDAANADAGREPLRAGAEAEVRTALAAIAESRLSSMPGAEEILEGRVGAEGAEMLARFVDEKRRTLQASAAALRASAARA